MFDSLKADFLLFLKTEKGLSNNTVEAYTRDLDLLFSHMKKMRFSSFSREAIIAFLLFLEKEGYAASSRARIFMSLKVFFRFILREGHVDKDFFEFLEPPKQWQKLPSVLSYEEIERLLDAPDDSPEEVRDRAILELLYASGARVSELVLLTIYSVGEDEVRLLGKGSKERMVPIGEAARRALENYFLHMRDKLKSEEEHHLFLTSKGKPLNRFQILYIIKKYGKKAGITKTISPHTLRHSFASHLMIHGADIRLIQELLGHGHIGSTDRYTHLDQSHLIEEFQNKHPRFGL